jgi:hypothetical protein
MNKNILNPKNEDTFVKCYSIGDSLENMLIIKHSQIIKISSSTNNNKLLIEYWDNRLRIETSFICDFIIPINE